MGVEILAADFTLGQVREATEGDDTFLSDINKNPKVNEGQGLEEPIKFGLVDSTQEMNGQTNAEVDNKIANFPMDAIDEWPTPKQIHTFYLVKFRPYDDLKLKAKIEHAEKDVQKWNQARFQIFESLKATRSERSNVISQLKPLTAEDKQYRVTIEGKRKEMEPLQVALGKLRSANNAEKGMGICSSEEELDYIIQSLHYRIQHESNTLVEEKKLLKDIKQLEGTREKVIANAAMKAKLQDSLGPKEAIHDQVKLIGVDLDGVRKEQQTVRAKIKNMEEDLKAIDVKINSLQEELDAVSQKKDKAYGTLNELRKEREEGNACFYQYRSLLNNVRGLAVKKDIALLGELCHDEVEKFMSLWSSDKAFRDDYEKRNLYSLDYRQLSRDGRMRNPDEKPILYSPVESDMTDVKGHVKQQKENVDAAPPQHVFAQKALIKEDIKKSTGSEPKGKASPDNMETYFVSEKSQKEPTATTEIDASKLKEMKREEEIAKAKLAVERKKKLSEKAAAKAAVRAQKEAEKKLKEKEKRAKKKGASLTATTPDEQTEVDAMIEEPEEPEVKKEAQAPPKNKEPKENARYRNRQKGPDQLPKITLKRKKSHSYWMWIAPAAIMSVVVAVVLGYYYTLGRN